MPAWLAPLAIGVGSQLAGKLLKGGGGRDRPDLDNQWLEYMHGPRERGETASDAYLDRAMGFDPMEALRTYGQGVYGDFSRNLNEAMQDYRGQQVGMGRLDTGFATEGEDRVVADLGERYQNRLAQGAMDATGMELRNTEGLGRYGQQQENTYLDMLARGLDRDTPRKNARDRLWSDVLGAGAGLAGTYLATR